MNSYPWKMNNIATQNSGLSEKNANVNHLIFESSSSDETEIQSESESIKSSPKRSREEEYYNTRFWYR